MTHMTNMADMKDMKGVNDIADMKDMKDVNDIADMKDMKDVNDIADMKDMKDVNDIVAYMKDMQPGPPFLSCFLPPYSPDHPDYHTCFPWGLQWPGKSGDSSPANRKAGYPGYCNALPYTRDMWVPSTVIWQ